MNDNYVRAAAFVRVKDGDTFVFLVDQGMRDRREEGFRLAGASARETRSADPELRALGLAAKHFAEDWFTRHSGHAGALARFPFRVQTVRKKVSFDPMTTFERYVARVECGEGHDLAAELLAAGLANTDPREG